MLSLASKCVTAKYNQYATVHAAKDAKNILLLSVVRVHESREEQDHVKIEFTDLTLSDIINDNIRQVESIEVNPSSLPTRSCVYLVKVTSSMGAIITRTIEKRTGSKSKINNLYYKCNFTFKHLTVKSVDKMKINYGSIQRQVNMNQDFCITHTKSGQYSSAFISSIIKTNSDVSFDVELIGLDQQELDDEILFEAVDELPAYKETGLSVTLVIPSGSALAYQYAKISVDDKGKITAGTCNCNSVISTTVTGSSTAKSAKLNGKTRQCTCKTVQKQNQQQDPRQKTTNQMENVKRHQEQYENTVPIQRFSQNHSQDGQEFHTQSQVKDLQSQNDDEQHLVKQGLQSQNHDERQLQNQSQWQNQNYVQPQVQSQDHLQSQNHSEQQLEDQNHLHRQNHSEQQLEDQDHLQSQNHSEQQLEDQDHLQCQNHSEQQLEDQDQLQNQSHGKKHLKTGQQQEELDTEMKKRDKIKEEKNCALPVFELLGNNQFRLVEKNLEKILNRPEVQGLPVCVVSMAGAVRTGKTFMLNFFRIFLEGKLTPNWLTEPSEVADRCKCVQWSGIQDAQAMSLYMWSKPFVVDKASNGHDKAAVILMDMQGNLDYTSSSKSAATIFALSTLVSSVQVYNITRRIGEDSLKHLEYFTEYGKHAVQNNDNKPFQNLKFLVRDHPRSSHLRGDAVGKEKIDGGKLPDYGSKAGEKYLKKVLEVDVSKQSSEQKQLRETLHSMFESLTCFLLPRPGPDIMDGCPFDYSNPMSDERNYEFLMHVQDLVFSVLSADNLMIKQHNGTPLTTDTYLRTFKELAETFISGDLPQIQTALEATTEAASVLAAANSKTKFMSDLQELTARKKKDSVLEDGELAETVELLKDNAIKRFKDSAGCGEEQCSRSQVETFKRELTEISERYTKELVDIPTKAEAEQNCRRAVAKCMKHFGNNLQRFKKEKKECATIETSELQGFYEDTHVRIIKEFQNQPKLGNGQIKQHHMQILMKQMFDAWQPVEVELSKKPTMREVQSSQEEAQQNALHYFRKKMHQDLAAELAKDEIDLSKFKIDMEHLKSNAISTFKHQKKYGGDALSQEYIGLLVRLVDEDIQDAINKVQKQAETDATNREAYDYCIKHFKKAMQKFLKIKAEQATLEREEIGKKYSQEMLKWQTELIYYDRLKSIQPKYVQLFHESCTKIYEDICQRLRDKPTETEFQQKKVWVYFYCFTMYKDDFRKYVLEQLEHQTYEPADVERRHRESAEKAFCKFDGLKLFGGDSVRNEQRQKLKERIECYFKESLNKLERCAFTKEKARQRNTKLRSKCYIKYLRAMRKMLMHSESHPNWFEDRHKNNSLQCLHAFDTGRIGSYDFSLSEKERLEREINKKFYEFITKTDGWFGLTPTQKDEYQQGIMELSDEQVEAWAYPRGRETMV